MQLLENVYYPRRNKLTIANQSNPIRIIRANRAIKQNRQVVSSNLTILLIFLRRRKLLRLRAYKSIKYAITYSI